MAAAAARKRSEELEDFENNSKQLRPGYPNPTVEEAGLKWRLIEDRRAMNLNNRGFLGNCQLLLCSLAINISILFMILEP